MPHSESIAKRLADFERRCREAGLPLTVQRRVIYEAALRHADHPTADQIVEIVKKQLPEISRTTVYRVLDALVELGVVRRLHHPGAAARFDGKTTRHHHLVCRRCHCVFDVECAELDALRLPEGLEADFELDDYSVHFSGVCAECRRKKRSRRTRRTK